MKKREAFAPRPKLFIGHTVVKRIVIDALAPMAHPLDHVAAMLYLATYTFLLRLPSEALPMSKRRIGFVGHAAQQSSLSLEVSCLALPTDC